jgi:hypothetical protein
VNQHEQSRYAWKRTTIKEMTTLLVRPRPKIKRFTCVFELEQRYQHLLRDGDAEIGTARRGVLRNTLPTPPKKEKTLQHNSCNIEKEAAA